MTHITETERADIITGYLQAAGWLVSDHLGAPEDERERGYEGDHRYGPFADDAHTHAAGALDDLCAALDDAADVRSYLDWDGHRQGNWSPAELFGHDLWLTRNGHGAGFWDRGLGDLGNRLSEAARSLGESYSYVLDDDAETVEVE